MHRTTCKGVHVYNQSLRYIQSITNVGAEK
jgi:hypothetical protein